MNMNGQAGAGGKRSTGSLRKAESPPERRTFRLNWMVHVVILALAVLMWWIARDMVSMTKSLKDQGRVRFMVSESLKDDWRVLSATEVPVTLEVSGPNKEINDFASELEQNPGRFAYMYEITESDIANLRPNTLHQITMDVDIRKFEPTGEAIVPGELSVRPLAGERVFRVTLEQYITRPARIDLGAGANGEIRIQGEREQREVWTYTVAHEPDHDLEVFGPASAVDTITGPMGIARPRVSIDAMQILQNVAGSDPEGRTVRDLVERSSITATVFIVPTPLVEVHEVLSEGSNGGKKVRTIQQVPIKLRFDRKEDYVEVSGDFTVNVIMPNWLASKGARIENLPREQEVVMLVLANQRDQFNSNNVRLMLDLSGITPDDYPIENSEDSNVRRMRVSNLFYSLDINTERITYRFATESITPELYFPLNKELSIVWTE